MIKAVIAASLTVLLSGWAAFPESESRLQAQQSRIAGAWRVVTVSGDSAGKRITRRYAGLYLFTQRHYSITRIDSNTPRRDFPATTKRTADTYLSIWGPVAAQAGTYEIQGGRITTRPLVSKNPAGMRPNVHNIMRWRLVGDTLWLETIANQDGGVKDGPAVRLLRAER